MRTIFGIGFLKRCVAAGAIAVATSGGALADNVTDAMIGAYKSSGLLEQNRALLRATDEDVASTRAALRPVIAAALAIGRSYSSTDPGTGTLTKSGTTTGTLSLSLNWTIFDSGQTRMNRAAAEQSVLATRQALVDVEQQVLFSAVQAYVNLLTQQDIVSLRRNNLRVLQEELRAANDRFEVGEVTRTDVALAESQVASARANLIDAQGDLLAAQAVYKEVVGRAPGAVTSYPPLPRQRGGLSSAEANALRRHPSLLSQQLAVKASELSADSALRAMGPSVDVSASASRSEGVGSDYSRDSSSVSMTLSQTIYAGGALASGRRASLARLDAERGALLSTQRSVTRAVASAFTSFETAQASLRSTDQQVRAAQVAFDGIREEATLGSRTTLDVLQAEQELLDAQTARLQARANQALAAYGLLQAQGLLTVNHLNLAVERYDPEVYFNRVKDAPAFISKRGQDLDRVLKAIRKD